MGVCPLPLDLESLWVVGVKRRGDGRKPLTWAGPGRSRGRHFGSCRSFVEICQHKLQTQVG